MQFILIQTRYQAMDQAMLFFAVHSNVEWTDKYTMMNDKIQHKHMKMLTSI